MWCVILTSKGVDFFCYSGIALSREIFEKSHSTHNKVRLKWIVNKVRSRGRRLKKVSVKILGAVIKVAASMMPPKVQEAMD